MRLLLSALSLVLAASPGYAQSHAPRSALTPILPAMTGFGTALVVGDGEVIVGEPTNSFRSGLVYVYRKSGGTWQKAATIAAPDSQVADRFGSSLAISGPDLFVGQARGAGKIHHYRKEGGTWRYASTISASDASEGDDFGSIIAASGDWLLAAASQQLFVVDGTGERSGGVYAFRRGADGKWSQSGKLPVTDPKAGDLIGYSIAIDGPRALVGAPGKNQRTGAAYAFRVDSAGTWREAGQIQRANLQRSEMFGFTVRLLGDTALVSLPFQDGGYGSVFAFRWVRDRSQWVEQGRLSAAARRGDRFGFAVAGHGSDIWVAAPNAAPVGRVYVYSADTAQPAVRSLTSPGSVDDRFGSNVAVRGNLAAVAASGADFGDGNVVIFERDPRGQWQQVTRLTTTVDALDAIAGAEKRCDGQGKVTIFDCKGADLRSFMPVTKLTTGRTSHLSGIWGWTDPSSNREYALVGRTDGTAFVDVTDAANPVFVGELPKTEGSPRNFWREIKTYQNHAYIVAEGAGHGMQVFDLTQLRGKGKGTPTVFAPTVLYDRVSAAHNVVINEESGFAYITGASGAGDNCGGALHMVDIRAPRTPKFAGCFADSTTGMQLNGYTHDAQCVMYKGPDRRYRGREICLSANETAVSISDVTDKARPKILSRGKYPDPGYMHQGWFTEDQRYWFMNDELDEESGKVSKTRTIIWDMADLEKPTSTEFLGTTSATDHNLFIKGNLMYQSNYQAGLRIIDITDPLRPKEVGYFDTAPYEPNVPGFEGTWSNYPFFKSGTIVVASGNEGLFLIKKSDRLTP